MPETIINCPFCGAEGGTSAKFCIECGKNWVPPEVDLSPNVSKYKATMRELFFDPQNDLGTLDQLSNQLCERLKISLPTRKTIHERFIQERERVSQLMAFCLEFNENILDAYAGQDTLLQFRFTNLAPTDLLKVSLCWNDPDLPDDLRFRTTSRSFLKKGEDAVLGATHVFARSGPKTIRDLEVVVSNQFQETAKFVASAFHFTVGHVMQNVVNYNTTHTQISIEGRGVVDASGIGADRTTRANDAPKSPNWKKLSVTYLPNDVESYEERTGILVGDASSSPLDNQQSKNKFIDAYDSEQPRSEIDLLLEQEISPKVIGDFIGQDKIRDQLKELILDAHRGKATLKNILLLGPPGVGKTTMALVIARELGTSIRRTSGPALESAGDLAAILTNQEDNDVLFIDQLHLINPGGVEQVLCSALETRQLDICIGEGDAARIVRLELPRITIIGETTDARLLSVRLRAAFEVSLELRLYSPDELKGIVIRSARLLDIPIADQDAETIANYAKGIPQTAIRILLQQTKNKK